MANISKERLAEMADNWNDETCDPETEAWRKDLAAAEIAIIAGWDKGYASGVLKLCQDILALNREGECHG